MSFLYLRSFAFLVLPVLPLALVSGQPIHAAPQRPARQEAPVVVSWTQPPKIQVLLDMPDVLIAKDSYRVSSRTTFGMTVAAVVVTDLHQNKQLKGLRIDLGNNNRAGDSSGASLLDIEEAAALSRSLTAMIDMATKGTRDDRRVSEVSFATLGGFVVTWRQDARGQHAYMLAGAKDVVRTDIEVTDLGSVKNLIEEALALLAAK